VILSYGRLLVVGAVVDVLLMDLDGFHYFFEFRDRVDFWDVHYLNLLSEVDDRLLRET